MAIITKTITTNHNNHNNNQNRLVRSGPYQTKKQAVKNKKGIVKVISNIDQSAHYPLSVRGYRTVKKKKKKKRNKQ